MFVSCLPSWYCFNNGFVEPRGCCKGLKRLESPQVPRMRHRASNPLRSNCQVSAHPSSSSNQSPVKRRQVALPSNLCVHQLYMYIHNKHSLNAATFFSSSNLLSVISPHPHDTLHHHLHYHYPHPSHRNSITVNPQVKTHECLLRSVVYSNRWE